jgi:hypothetical protein
MSWEEAFAHPLLADFMTTPSNGIREREEKENRTPRRQVLMDIRDKDRNRSKSKSVSATKASHFSRTPKRPKVLTRNFDVTPDRKSPWRM